MAGSSGTSAKTALGPGPVIRERLTEIRRFITAVVAPHAVLQPKGRWSKHLDTQLGAVECTLDVIADCTDV